MTIEEAGSSTLLRREDVDVGRTKGSAPGDSTAT